MPSTIGHALAGATIARAADAWDPRARPGPRPDASNALMWAAAAIAAAPDIDLLFGVHRTITHSVGATIFVALFAAALAANARAPVVRVAVVCAAAHASHLLLDWLAADRFPPYGIEALWPFSRAFYISGLDLFRQTERRRFFTLAGVLTNTRAVVQEIAILGPIAYAVEWFVRRRSSRAQYL